MYFDRVSLCHFWNDKSKHRASKWYQFNVQNRCKIIWTNCSNAESVHYRTFTFDTWHCSKRQKCHFDPIKNTSFHNYQWQGFVLRILRKFAHFQGIFLIFILTTQHFEWVKWVHFWNGSRITVFSLGYQWMSIVSKLTSSTKILFVKTW